MKRTHRSGKLGSPAGYDGAWKCQCHWAGDLGLDTKILCQFFQGKTILKNGAVTGMKYLIPGAKMPHSGIIVRGHSIITPVNRPYAPI